MRTTSTFSILFWAYTSRAKNNQANLYVRITVNGKKVNISLKQKVDISLWDPSKQRMKGKSEIHRNLNYYLDRVHSQLIQIYQDLKFKGQLITCEIMKSQYLGEDNTSKTLNELLEYHTQKTSKTLSKGTLRNFKVTEGYIKKYLTSVLKTSDIYLKELDYKFIYDFSNYLHSFWPKNHPKSMGNNTVMKHIQRFRKIITLGYHIEWIDKDPFVRWKPTYEKRERPFLTQTELSNIENHKFLIARLERVRDLFIFSCYTGIAYIDIMSLSQENIIKGIDGNDWIFTSRQKTKEPVKVPLLSKSCSLIEKYKNHPLTQETNTLFPKITNEKVNFYLKEIALATGLKKNLTFHMARHTFATTVTLSNGVPIETVSKLLGHSKIASTQIYARVIDKKVSDDMRNLRNKIETNRNV
ncbi:site-specific integrase [Cellulophaga omnivescoria]|uniref:site-specific integrase n=1 Tax=Cellulophaga omnivescoria TaxID=1888890 RepID=UPI00098467CD|nr:site-specific integrase [Cellulophaga omnivescoria]